jgi:hypothetical protein
MKYIDCIIKYINKTLPTALSAYYDLEKEQLFISSLDLILTNVIIIIFILAESKKDVKFFEDEAPVPFLDAPSLLQNSKILPADSFYEIHK